MTTSAQAVRSGTIEASTESEYLRQINLVSAIGSGSTFLSSFDAALFHCGVCNYNLIPLSSVIPPGSEIVEVSRHLTPEEEFDHRLYVVKADIRSACAGDVVAAGIGWYQWGNHRGVFVEHELIAATSAAAAAELSGRIHDSLRDLCMARDIAFDPTRVGSRCAIAGTNGIPTTALVLAVYESAAWSTPVDPFASSVSG